MNQIVFMNENDVLPKAEGYVIKSKNEEISKKGGFREFSV